MIRFPMAQCLPKSESYQFPKAAVTKSHKQGNLNIRNFLPFTFPGRRFKTKGWQGWFLRRSVRRSLFLASPPPTTTYFLAAC